MKPGMPWYALAGAVTAAVLAGCPETGLSTPPPAAAVFFHIIYSLDGGAGGEAPKDFGRYAPGDAVTLLEPEGTPRKYTADAEYEFSGGWELAGNTYPPGAELILDSAITAAAAENGDITLTAAYQAVSARSGDYHYKVLQDADARSVQICGYSGDPPNGELAIAAAIQVDGAALPVTRIGERAFDAAMPWRAGKGKLTQAAIPPSVAVIERNAFAGNDLRALDFPPDSALETIGEGAFQSNRLERISLPAGLVHIGHSAFLDNRLEFILIPGASAAIGNSAFAKNRLRAAALGRGLQTIGASAFYDNELEALYYPDEAGAPAAPFPAELALLPGLPPGLRDEETEEGVLPALGNAAFAKNRLRSVLIPPGLTRIGDSAFASNALEALVIPPGVTAIGAWAFENNPLASLVIESAAPAPEEDAPALAIGNSAFRNHRLAALDLPPRVAGVGGYAFAHDRAEDSSLTALTLHEGLTEIGARAFAGNRLAALEVPNTVTSVGYGAFTGNLLRSLAFAPGGEGGAEIQGRAFAENLLETSAEAPLTVPERFAQVDWTAFAANPPLKHLKIEIKHSGSLSSEGYVIGQKAFADYTLEEIDIGSAITGIAEGAFDSPVKGIQGVIIRGGGAQDGTAVLVEAGAFAGHPVRRIVITGAIAIGSGGSLGSYGDGFKSRYEGQGGGAGVYTLDDSDPRAPVWTKQEGGSGFEAESP